MQQLKKSIQKLLKKSRKKSKEIFSPSPKIETTLSSYVTHPAQKYQQKLRSHNPVSKHSQEQENMRLFRKLTEIKRRHNTYDHSPEEQLYDKVYRLNMASRRVQREIKDKNLQSKNSEFIERIVSIRRNHSPGFFEGKSLQHSRQRKRTNKSVLLPPIEGVVN